MPQCFHQREKTKGEPIMKKILTMLLALVMLLSIAVTGGAETAEKRHLVFAWVVDNVDLSQQSFIDYAQVYIDYLNSTREDFSLEITARRNCSKRR